MHAIKTFKLFEVVEKCANGLIFYDVLILA